MPPAPRDGKRSTRAAPEPRVPSTAAPRRGWCRSHPVRGAPARPHVPRHGPAGSARCAHLPAGQPGLGVPELGRLEAVHGAPGPPRRAAPPSAPPRPAARPGQGRARPGRCAQRGLGALQAGSCPPSLSRPPSAPGSSCSTHNTAGRQEAAGPPPAASTTAAVREAGEEPRAPPCRPRAVPVAVPARAEQPGSHTASAAPLQSSHAPQS